MNNIPDRQKGKPNQTVVIGWWIKLCLFLHGQEQFFYIFKEFGGRQGKAAV